MDASIGYQLGIFRPGISYKFEGQSFNNQVSGGSIAPTTYTTSTTVFMIGGGLALDIPMSSTVHLVAQGDYRVPVSHSSSISSCNSVLGQVGLEFLKF